MPYGTIWLTSLSIFDENESETFQTFLKMVGAMSPPESEKSLPKINADDKNEFKKEIKRIKILNKEVVSNKKFYGMCVKEFHQNHLTMFFLFKGKKFFYIYHLICSHVILTNIHFTKHMGKANHSMKVKLLLQKLNFFLYLPYIFIHNFQNASELSVAY